MDRLDDKTAMELYEHASLHELGAAANAASVAIHPEPWRTFVVDRNINYTNVCRTRCKFCAFAVEADDPRAYVLGRDELLEKVRELVAVGGTQVLLQGGMHEALAFSYYLDLLRAVRRAYPAVQLHAFGPAEIWFFHERFGLSVEAVLARLMEAGLSSLPGGGAEVLADRVRSRVSPLKCTSSQWLTVMRCAHALGLMTTATMMFGHVDRPADRLAHLRRVRRLQDESLSRGRGHFTAFICWTFQSGHTPLSRQGQADCEILGGVPYVKMLATSRLYLNNFSNVQVSWVTQGPRVAQVALRYGANDMGGLMMEENVVATTGTRFRITRDEMEALIRGAGYRPRQRDGFYRLL
ncbi:MAG: dehypoxanthine futalosine cyclase [Phycisphaerae bacterium]|nr:dehypoxanthine futalosine cyclase [Phycisphaerae bacterium]